VTKPGEPQVVETVVTFLEMTAPPLRPAPPPPMVRGYGTTALLRTEQPPVHFYRYLYETIGGPYQWVQRKGLSDEALAALIRPDTVDLYCLYVGGCPAGMAELECADLPNSVNLNYFGLMQEYLGLGIGRYFLHHMVEIMWSKGPAKLTVNTCTLDHPAALPLYQRLGFAPVKRETQYLNLPS